MTFARTCSRPELSSAMCTVLTTDEQDDSRMIIQDASRLRWQVRRDPLLLEYKE